MSLKFWDASALVPLCVLEKSTPDVRDLIDASPLIVWSLSRVEVVSAIERRARERVLSSSGRSRALSTLASLHKSWVEIGGSTMVEETAIRILATHVLRAADALQLAAAIAASEGSPLGSAFVCVDARLGKAAALEGFRILP